MWLQAVSAAAQIRDRVQTVHPLQWDTCSKQPYKWRTIIMLTLYDSPQVLPESQMPDSQVYALCHRGCRHTASCWPKLTRSWPTISQQSHQPLFWLCSSARCGPTLAAGCWISWGPGRKQGVLFNPTEESYWKDYWEKRNEGFRKAVKAGNSRKPLPSRGQSACLGRRGGWVREC